MRLTSALMAPESIKFFCIGLKSRPLTGPVCLLLVKILASSALMNQLCTLPTTHLAPARILSGL
jgi:hypothetical protein